ARTMQLEPGRLHRVGPALVAELPQERDVLALGEPAVDLPDPGGSVRLHSRADLEGAERWLLSTLVKETEGFMSRHVERKISLAITRRLAGTRITPNAMTLVSVAVGLLGAGFFLSTQASMQLAGALLFLFHSILD